MHELAVQDGHGQDGTTPGRGSLELIVDGLTIARGERIIIADLSFRVAAGEVLVVTGANGAGKSTLLRVLAGLLPALSGSVRLDAGRTKGATRDDAEIGEQCHLLGADSAAKPSMSVAENLAFWGRFLCGDPSRLPAALAALDLAALADFPAGDLSLGQRRRLALARLLVAERTLWLLDEPTSALDRHSAGLFAGLVAGHLQAGGIAIAASHLDLGIAGARELRLAEGRGRLVTA